MGHQYKHVKNFNLGFVELNRYGGVCMVMLHLSCEEV